jgi:hypothetical protein
MVVKIPEPSPRACGPADVDLHKAVDEVVAHAEAHPLEEHGEIGRGRNRDYNVSSNQHGNSADYLARRMRRDHPEVFDGLKAGTYK